MGELIEEESVELLYNVIINQEVYQHIGDNVANAVSEYNHVVDDNRAFAPFRMNEKWKDKISRITDICYDGRFLFQKSILIMER